MTFVLKDNKNMGPVSNSQYKDHLSRYGDFHYKGKTVLRPSYFYNWTLYLYGLYIETDPSFCNTIRPCLIKKKKGLVWLDKKPGGCFKNKYELINLRALKISMLCKNHIVKCMGKIFCVEFNLWFHTEYLPIHWKIWILFIGENLRALRFKSLYMGGGGGGSNALLSGIIISPHMWKFLQAFQRMFWVAVEIAVNGESSLSSTDQAWLSWGAILVLETGFHVSDGAHLEQGAVIWKKRG